MSREKVEYIPNTLDINVFKPINKGLARQILNLPLDKHVIVFGADAATTNPYKGWRYLQQALSRINSKNTIVVVFGSSYSEKIQEAVLQPIVFLGRIQDEFTMSLVYNAADVFVAPSLAEAFGQTVLESMACGTPVVGFDVGGIPDMVNKETGYLAIYKDADDLARGIDYVLDLNGAQGFATREKSLEFGPEKIIAQHKHIWQELKVS